MYIANAVVLCMLCILASEVAIGQQTKANLIVGVDANYAEGMERDLGAVWKWHGEQRDLFDAMHARGVDAFRVRLWVGDDGPHGTQAASRVITRAIAAGIDPYLVIFLSDDWADLMKQPVPKAWKELSFEERLSAVENYSREVVAKLRQEGLTNHLYEIGNEIDYGICGEYPGKRSKKNPATLARQVWPRTAKLILASQAGVRAADSDAKFMLHVSHWWDAEFCRAFYEYMLGQGVQIDYAGLSYFPSANIGGSLEIYEFAETVKLLAGAIQRPIIVPETAYPSTRDFKGQFSRWKYDAMGYPLTSDGQRRWISDFFAMCATHPDIHAVYYWSPEWCGEGMWKGFALFEPDGTAKPAWEAFDRVERFETYLPECVVLEVRGQELFRVPVESACNAMVEMIATLRAQTGGVTVEHIEQLSSNECVVEQYAIGLRASLQNNMHMSLQPHAKGLELEFSSDDVWRAIEVLMADTEVRRHRVVLVCRGEASASAIRVAEHLRSLGFRVAIHPMPDGAPLKFGMSGRFAPGATVD